MQLFCGCKVDTVNGAEVTQLCREHSEWDKTNEQLEAEGGSTPKQTLIDHLTVVHGSEFRTDPPVLLDQIGLGSLDQMHRTLHAEGN